MQLYARKDGVPERDYGLFSLLDLGDIVCTEGYLFRTRTGELSLHVEKLEFLSKTLMGMPEKFHGLEDTEMRFRRRYLDLIANPDVRNVFVTRAKIISSMRRQLEDDRTQLLFEQIRPFEEAFDAGGRVFQLLHVRQKAAALHRKAEVAWGGLPPVV